MLDYEVHRCSRRCAATDREFAPGEAIYSVLIAEGKDVVRKDYAVGAWTGPPAGAIGWWKGTVPSATNKKVSWAPGEVLIGYFEELANDPARSDVRYLLALLMVRRKHFRQEAIEKEPDGSETLVVFCPRNEQTYRLPAVMPPNDRLAEVQQELLQLLQAEGGGA
jgi:hypothetical protein